MVRTLRRRVMDSRPGRGKEIQHPPGTLTPLERAVLTGAISLIIKIPPSTTAGLFVRPTAHPKIAKGGPSRN
jgi:hypothetical protein